MIVAVDQTTDNKYSIYFDTDTDTTKYFIAGWAYGSYSGKGTREKEFVADSFGEFDSGYILALGYLEALRDMRMK